MGSKDSYFNSQLVFACNEIILCLNVE